MTELRFFLSYGSAIVGVALTRFAVAIAIYQMTGLPEHLVGGLVVAYLPEILAGWGAAFKLKHIEAQTLISFLAPIHSVLVFVLVLAFTFKSLFLIYLLIFLKGITFGMIDTSAKTMLSTKSGGDTNIHRLIAFRQGIIFGAVLVANGLGAAWLEWGAITPILILEAVSVFQMKPVLKKCFQTQCSISQKISKSLLNVFQENQIRPWLVVLFLKSIGDGVSIIAIRTVLIGYFNLSSGAAGLYGSIVGAAAMTCMFLVSFTPAKNWRGTNAMFAVSIFIMLWGSILAYGYYSNNLFIFITCYVFCCLPYCITDMKIQSMPFVIAVRKSGAIAGAQETIVAMGTAIGILSMILFNQYLKPTLFGLPILMCSLLAGIIMIISRNFTYAKIIPQIEN